MFNKYLFLTIIFLFFSNVNLVKAQEKIAFIDLNYIFDNSDAGKKFLKEVDNKKKKINNEFEKYKKEIKNDTDNLIKQKNVIAKEEFDKKAIELEKNTKKYKTAEQNFRKNTKNEKNKCAIKILDFKDQKASKEKSINFVSKNLTAMGS